MNDLVLKIRDLHVGYGPIQVIKGIDLDIPRGKIVALLGSNGAGKTTTLRAISGLIKSSGEILLENENIAGLSVNRIARMGVCHAPEGRRIFPGFTVEENLRAGAFGITAASGADGVKKSASQKTAENLERVYALFPILHERKKQQGSTLSGGEQQMLAVARALMGNPKLLILDEPSLGLAPLIIKDIFKALSILRENGTTILIVEQNAYATLKLADYAYVLELGRIGIQGPASELIKDERLIEVYFGGKRSKS